MKIQITVDINIDLEADKQHVAEILSEQTREFLTKHLRNVKHELSVLTQIE